MNMANQDERQPIYCHLLEGKGWRLYSIMGAGAAADDLSAVMREKVRKADDDVANGSQIPKAFDVAYGEIWKSCGDYSEFGATDTSVHEAVCASLSKYVRKRYGVPLVKFLWT